LEMKKMGALEIEAYKYLTWRIKIIWWIVKFSIKLFLIVQVTYLQASQIIPKQNLGSQQPNGNRP
jgi:hypothetical protein